jgi:lysophospholipase L1-like esterase
MKTILIYGDSNVWGDTPNAKRLPDGQQWANILQQKLGDEYKIVQEGLAGRFAGNYNYEPRPHYNGQYCFDPIYRTASPVDVVVLALGTNDLNDRYERSPGEITEDILWYEAKAKILIDDDETAPIFIYVLPPNFTGKFKDETFNLDKREMVNIGLKAKVSNYVEVNYIDLSSDGLHFSPKGHEQMAEAVFEKVKELGL